MHTGQHTISCCLSILLIVLHNYLTLFVFWSTLTHYCSACYHRWSNFTTYWFWIVPYLMFRWGLLFVKSVCWLVYFLCAFFLLFWSKILATFVISIRWDVIEWFLIQLLGAIMPSLGIIQILVQQFIPPLYLLILKQIEHRISLWQFSFNLLSICRLLPLFLLLVSW